MSRPACRGRTLDLDSSIYHSDGSCFP
ncbi:hypothetical protein NC652_007432 [Populus alba x Populus x berolinensis]|nr:hypothetical protein NC652_007432 [Populus alba x Populus x berolinensis]